MSKRSPHEYEQDPTGVRYWKSLGELAGDAELLKQLPAEFPPGITDPPDGMSRRAFFNLMGASAALAGLAACRSPEEKIVPYAHAAEEQLPGTKLVYATATTFAGSAVGILAESHDGRPTKLEGNPAHPDTPGGGLSPWVQASILDLYDPDRADRPRVRKGTEFADATWVEAAATLKQLGTRARARQGAGLAIITEGHRSPTLKAALAQVKAAMPQARIIRWDPAGRDAQREGTRIAFGKPQDTVLDTARAKVLITLDADILASEGSIVRQAQGFARGRRPGADMNRLYAIESSFTVTGTAADHRLRLQSRQVFAFTLALAAELGGDLGSLAPAGARAGLPEEAARWAKLIAKDLVANRGAGLVVAGAKQPPVVHAICAAINASLGNIGTTVRFLPAFDDGPDGGAAMVELATAIGGGAIDSVLVLGGNPAFTAPADAPLADALTAAQGKVTLVRLGSHFDETSALAALHLNRSHDLESWSDVVSEDGTASIVQPLIAPLFDSRTDAEVVALLLGEGRRAFDMVRGTWQALSEKAWRKALHDGVIDGTAAAPAAAGVAVQVQNIMRVAQPPSAEGMEVTFAPDSHAWDGRFANNAWLQEWPNPMHKECWGNAASLSPTTAKKLGVSDGDIVAVEAAGRSIRVSVIVAPGHADDSLALSFGQGRQKTGRVGTEVGTDVYPLRATTGMGLVGDVKVTSLGAGPVLARTQEHFSLEPMAGWARRPLVRVGTLTEWQSDHAFQRKEEPKHPELLSLWKEPKVDIVHKWGLAIDLQLCTGCASCQIACQAENNIPVVGADGVRRSRELNWLRVDRYFEGAAENARAVAQPMPCQQCESAPCESVCPVAATTHSAEGLNDMAYNRCVGTRYCANNCPFKVRKFNYFNYHKHLPALTQMQYNPDVTVRSRGVMEKCTYCVQRIQEGKIAAKREGTDHVKDGAIRTACQQACPTGAIVFGDYNDKDAQVTKLEADPRTYRLLEELNIRPRTVYLAKVRNLNPELESA